MPQLSTIQTQSTQPLPTSDYVFGLDQLYANAEAVRNQRRRNIQAVEAAKRALAAKGLSGDVQVDDMGRARINATKESLQSYFGVPTLTDEMTSDAALYGFKRDDNSFSKAGTLKVSSTGHLNEALSVADRSIQQAVSPAQINAFNAITERGTELASGGVIPTLPLSLPQLKQPTLPTAPQAQIPLQAAQNPPLVPQLLQAPQPNFRTQTMQKAGQSSSAGANYEASAELPYLKSLEDKDTVITEQTLGAQYKDFMPYDFGTLLGNQALTDMASIAGADPTGQQMNIYNDMVKQKSASIEAFNKAMSATINPIVNVEQGGFKVDIDKLKASIREGVTSSASTNISSGNVSSGGGAKQKEDQYHIAGIDVERFSNGDIKFKGNGQFSFNTQENEALATLVQRSTKYGAATRNPKTGEMEQNAYLDQKEFSKNVFEEMAADNAFNEETINALTRSTASGKSPSIVTFTMSDGANRNYKMKDGKLVDVSNGKVLNDAERKNVVRNARAYDIKDDTYKKRFFAFNPGNQKANVDDDTWRINAKAIQNITGAVGALANRSSTQKQASMGN